VGDFTVLMGLSSAGKTTVLRALQFLFYGEWDATYPLDDKEATAVAIELETGTRVIRMRKGNTNSAAISTVTPEGRTVTKYKSFGAVIPGLFNLLNVKPIDIGSKSINLNFSMQDDPIFMVSESRPVKAQWLGRLYGAHVVNEMLKMMAKDKTTADGKRKNSEARLGKYRAELKQYDNLAEHEAAVQECKDLMAQVKLVKNVIDAREMLRQEKAAIDGDAWVLKADVKSVKEDLRVLASLKVLADKRAEVVEDRAFIADYSCLLKTDLAKMRRGVQMVADLDRIANRLKVIGTAKAELAMQDSEIATEIESRRGDLEAALKDGHCPTCGQSIAGMETKTILNNLQKEPHE
jgi:hypothetical protein